MTCLDPAGDKRKRLENRRKVYLEVVLPMVQKMNQSPGEWLEWHSTEKKEEFKALIAAAKEEMKKIYGDADSAVFGSLKFEAAVAERCEALRQTHRTDANGGVRPTAAQHKATNAAIAKVSWSASQLSIHMHTHAQLLCLQVFYAEQRSLKQILEQNDLLQLFLEGVKLDDSGELLFPWKSVWDAHDVFNLTGGVGECEILVSGR